MYAYIEGTIEQITEAGIVLDHDGIGYEIGMSSSDLAALSGCREPLRIYTYFQVSENGVSLFGF
ncbi:MAG: Holliday junction branch migration protein RuvA, partial [Lachnospiraceae bacterium]|nr:Holliday junction branch migration protein RuvA [Lachnospiraceae bacterium]